MANELHYTTAAFSDYFDSLKVIQREVKVEILSVWRLLKETHCKSLD